MDGEKLARRKRKLEKLLGKSEGITWEERFYVNKLPYLFKPCQFMHANLITQNRQEKNLYRLTATG